MRTSLPAHENSGRRVADGGVQSVARAVSLLKLIARHGGAGARLLELTEGSSLPRPTVHRILRCLCAEHLVKRDQDTRRYRLGMLAFELGLAAVEPNEIVVRCRPALADLAQRCGDTVYLVMRSGDEIVCLERVEGPFPIRTFTFTPGTRRLMGMGAGGLALLAGLESIEIDEIFSRISKALSKDGNLSPEAWRERIDAVRSTGVAVSEGTITPGVTGVGVAVPAAHGAPYLAVSIAAISSRLPEQRIAELAHELRATALALRAALPHAPASEAPAVSPRGTPQSPDKRKATASNPSVRERLRADVADVS